MLSRTIKRLVRLGASQKLEMCLVLLFFAGDPMSAERRFFEGSYWNLAPLDIDDETFHRDLRAAIGMMSPVPAPWPLIRIGGSDDGAYLLPDDLNGIEACFSPGVNNRKDFEDELARKFGIKSHMCDFTSDENKLRTPLIAGMQTFKKLWLDNSAQDDAITLSDWVSDLATPDGDLMLQIDIEGAEYRNLLSCDDELLSRFRVISIEIHSLKDMLDREIFYGVIFPFFTKLSRHFVCVHAHPNNHARVVYNPGSHIKNPDVIELTLVRRDRIRRPSTNEMLDPMLPHPLDITNAPERKPIVLSDFWLSGKERAVASKLKIYEDELIYERKSHEKTRTQLLGAVDAALDLLPDGLEDSSELHADEQAFEEIGAGANYSLSSVWGDRAKTGVIPHRIETGYFFHTDIGPNQSILIDLGAVRKLRKIEVFNRIGAEGERAKYLFASLSQIQGGGPTHVYRMPPTADFISGKAPSIKRFSPAVEARYVKLSSPVITALHFSMIRIYAEP